MVVIKVKAAYEYADSAGTEWKDFKDFIERNRRSKWVFASVKKAAIAYAKHRFDWRSVDDDGKSCITAGTFDWSAEEG